MSMLKRGVINNRRELTRMDPVGLDENKIYQYELMIVCMCMSAYPQTVIQQSCMSACIFAYIRMSYLYRVRDLEAMVNINDHTQHPDLGCQIRFINTMNQNLWRNGQFQD